MRAIQIARIGEVISPEVPTPTAGAGQVLLRVTAAGLCQTDIHVRSPKVQMIPDGIVPGREIAGEVVEVADDVHFVAVGSQAIVHPCWWPEELQLLPVTPRAAAAPTG